MFDIDDKGDGLGAERAEAMKRFPNRVPSRVDFDLEDFDPTDPLPCDLVNLYDYKHELFWDNIAQGIRNDERRPASVWLQRLMDEMGMDEQRMEMLLFAGEMVKYQAELDAMSDEELHDHFAMRAQMDEAFSDADGLGGVFDQIVERVRREADERDALERMWEE